MALVILADLRRCLESPFDKFAHPMATTNFVTFYYECQYSWYSIRNLSSSINIILMVMLLSRVNFCHTRVTAHHLQMKHLHFWSRSRCPVNYVFSVSFYLNRHCTVHGTVKNNVRAAAEEATCATCWCDLAGPRLCFVWGAPHHPFWCETALIAVLATALEIYSTVACTAQAPIYRKI